MKELARILEKSLLDDSSLSITIHFSTPELVLRITDSRQMIIYGIGLDTNHGFTLNLHFGRISNKGEKIIARLQGDGFLADFKKFEDKSSTIYVKDFGQDIPLLKDAVFELVNRFRDDRMKQSYHLTVNRTGSNYSIE